MAKKQTARKVRELKVPGEPHAAAQERRQTRQRAEHATTNLGKVLKQAGVEIR